MYTYEDLKKAPVGTKIMFEDGQILVKDCEDIFENDCYGSNVKELENFTDNRFERNGLGKIIKIEEPNYTIVYEVKDILDAKEREYLSNVIKPFRNKVQRIIKRGNLEEFIEIDAGRDIVNLPYFKANTMYKGMKENKEYSLEELDL